MAQPPIDPVIHLPYEDAYKISSRDMSILREALHYKSRCEMLEREIVSLNKLLEKATNGS